MTTCLFGLGVSLGLSPLSFAQGAPREEKPAPKTNGLGVPTEGADGEEAESATSAKQGVRFVFKELPKNSLSSQIYFMDSPKSAKKVPFSTGIPSLRFAITPGMTEIVLLNKALEGKVKAEDIIARAPIPSGIGKKMLAMLIPAQDGSWKIFFTDETKMEQGGITFINFTTENLHLKAGEDMLVFEPLKQQVYHAKNVKKGQAAMTKATLYRKHEASGKWYSVRDFSLQTQPMGCELNLFVWNTATKSPDIQRVFIMPDIQYGKSGKKRGAAAPSPAPAS